MFAAKLPLRKFRNYQTNANGIGAAISKLERLEDDPALTKIPVHAGDTKSARHDEA
jgi:hypothetical protein